jgi:hypothetical protein
MNRWRVGEDRGSKETNGCPLTGLQFYTTLPLRHDGRKSMIFSQCRVGCSYLASFWLKAKNWGTELRQGSCGIKKTS